MRRVFLSLVLVVVAIVLQSNQVEVDSLRTDAMKGLYVESGYEQEMAAWAYYCINGADGVETNYNEAIMILEKLVARDKYNVDSDKFSYVVEGYNLLGDCYENGYGVERDIDVAKEYWQRAADHNHADAFAKLTTYQNTSNATKKTSTKQSSSSRKSNFTMTINGVSYKMVFVEGGSFYMGSNDFESEGDERPIHKVTLSDYYIGATEVTQELWKAVMGNNPSGFKGSKRPVENVSWYDCQEFIKRLNKLTGKKFCLPSEAEWEFAARGGIRSRGYKYSGSNSINEVAWCLNNSSSMTHPVATKKANELGIYDMCGNAREWCSDWDGEYSSSSQTNPMGPSYGYNRALRGGSWGSNPIYCRVANRDNNSPNLRYNYYGFRLALRP